MKAWVILSLVVVAMLAFGRAEPEPPSAYGAPAAAYGAPASGYSGGGGGGGGWAQPVQSSGWGWKPKVRYLNLKIPIPQLPKIRLGIRAGIKASVSHGWGWRK